MRDVDTFIREGRSIIENYRITLESLKHKVIHDKLVEHLYLEVPEDGHICTLFDWANVQDLEVLEKELTSELDQLSVCLVYLRIDHELTSVCRVYQNGPTLR